MTIENITCPYCRFRHPADRSCEEAKRLADIAREVRERNKEEEALTENEDLADLVSKALHRAFQMGKIYWIQSASESDKTQAKFNELVEDIRKEILK